MPTVLPLPDLAYRMRDRSGFGAAETLYVLTERSGGAEPDAGGGVISGILFGTWSGTGAREQLGFGLWSGALADRDVDEGAWTDG